MLNQFSSGLNMLGLLTAINKWPHQFKEMFVYSEGKVTSNSVKEILVPPENMKRLQQNVWQLLLEYLDNSNQAGTVLNHAQCIIIITRNTCTQQPLAQGNDLKMKIFAFPPLFKKQ